MVDGPLAVEASKATPLQHCCDMRSSPTRPRRTRQAETDQTDAGWFRYGERRQVERGILRAEEIADLHAKIDALRTAQWEALIAMQQEQIVLLEQIVKREA